jgi:hypothetical protein
MAKATHIETANNRKVKIFGDTEKLKQVLTSVTVDGETIQPPGTSTVTAFSRKRYPGAPAVQVAGHPRAVNKNPGTELGIMPGKTFFVERPGSKVPLVKRKLYQFAYSGRWCDVQKVFETKGIGKFVLRGATGAGTRYGGA